MMAHDLEAGMAFHRAGRLAEAEAVYREILSRDPRSADALNLLGVLACQRGNYPAAVDLAGQAVAAAPASAEYRVNLGEAQRRAGRLEEALASFQKACDLEPANASAWYNQAVALAAAGRTEDALETYRRAITIMPALAAAHNNLGLLLHARGDFTEAIASFRRAITHSPAQAEAYNNLGHSLWKHNQHEEALAAFYHAAELKPGLAAAHANAGAALRKMGRRQEAVESLRRATALEPHTAWVWREAGMAFLELGDNAEALRACRRAADLAAGTDGAAEALHSVGVVLATSGDLPAGVAAYEQAIALDPAREPWRFELAALRGEHVPTAPDAYVRSLFDEYAPRFEQHLVGELDYRVPEQLLEVVTVLSHAGKIPPPLWDVLDLGCGTGRCGELFRPHARHMTGVDLSPNMIEAARRRGVYDELEEAHIVPALRRRAGRCDVILAADVFIYVGALEEVFAAASEALRPGGVIAFSLEHHDGDGFILHRRQRFAHSLGYMRRVANVAGLVELVAHQAVLRTDVSPGWVMAWSRPPVHRP